MKTMLAVLVLMLTSAVCRAEGGNVQGTPTRLRGGTANSIPKYDTAGSLNAGSLTDSGSVVTVTKLLQLQKTAVGGGQGGAFQGINVSSIIPVTSSYETLISSAFAGMRVSTITLTSTPNISTVAADGSFLPDGLFMVLGGTTPTSIVVLQSTGTLANSGVRLNAGTRAVGNGSKLGLVFNLAAQMWEEAFYTR